MAIDFTIPEEAKEVRERVRKWVQEECIPAEKEMAAGKPYKEVLAELRAKARAKGLWLPLLPGRAWRHGPRAARQCAGPDGARAEPPWRPFHELPGSRTMRPC
jgi:alkylation response protein AidB-like acyl-CoA dehydrogenase